MRHGLRHAAAALAVGIIATLAPLGAHAGTCDSNIVIFSSPVGLNSNAVKCLAAGEDGGDGRIINPGSNAISLRYIVDVGADTPTLIAVLNGLGFTNKEVELKRASATGGGFVYNSSAIALPNGSASTGCITASIADVEESTAFHTVDSSCAL